MIDIISGTEPASTSESRGGAKLLLTTVLLCLVVAGVGYGIYWYRTHSQVAAAVDTQASMAAVKTADAARSKAAAAHDVESLLASYADDAYVLPPYQESVTRKSAIRKLWTDLLVKGTDFSWQPGAADVSSSGDLVYIEGYYINTTTPAAKGKGKAEAKPSIDRGKYLSVWKKQADGSWKCVADTWNTDLPKK